MTNIHSNIDIDWEVHYEALLEYYREHGHCNVPFKLTYQCTLPGRNEDGTDIQYLGNLGRWLDRQRQTKKGHRPEKLRQDREAMLQKLVDEGKLAWTASHKKDTWYRSYLALLEFGKINGHCNVRAKYEFECDLPADLMPDPDLRHYSGKLGTWVEHQRQSKKGKGTPLFADREMLLQQLVDEGKYNVYMCLFNEYYIKICIYIYYSVLLLFTNIIIINLLLFIIIYLYTGKFLWDASEYSSSGLSHQNHDHKWPIVYGALLEYGKVHGDYNVPINCHFECNVSNPETDEIVRYSGRLGRWLYAQRVAKRGDSRGAPLGPDKEALLQQLVDEGRLWWDPPSQKTNYSTGAAPVRITTTTTTTTTTISNATSTERRSELSFLGSYVALLEYGRLKGDYNIQGVFSGSLLSINNENLSVTYTGDLLGWLEKQRQARKGYGTKLPAEYRSLFHRLASKGKLSWESSGASNATATLTTTTSEPTVGYCAPIMNNNAYTQNWQNHYLALLEYENENGHCNVPIGCIYQCMLPDGTKFSSNLGVWLHSQRISQLGYFHRPPLQPEHAALLQELVDQDKLVWDEAAVHITNLDIENWDIHYAALLEYDQEYGHSNVPTEFTYHCELSNGMKYQGELGQWLNIQRRLKQEQEHSVSGQSSAAAFSLHPQHMSHLQILVNNGHMSWEIAAESPILTTEEVQRICWLFHSAALVQFEREMGHCNVPVEMTYQCEVVFAPEETARFVYIGALGRWLADEKVALAQEEPKIHCNSLVHRRRPALNVSDRHEFFQSFISQGKLLFDASTIGQGNNSKLSDVHEISWLAHYLALLEFCRVHGHCDVPFDHVFECELPSPNTNPRSTKFLYVDNLGTWLCKQKLTRHGFAGKFLPERELLLQQLVGEGKLVWTILSGTSGGDMENSWDDHYAALIEYSKVKGHCNPPFTLVFDCKLPSGKYRGNLGIWVYKQRFARLGLGESLSNDQKEKLQHLVDEGIIVY